MAQLPAGGRVRGTAGEVDGAALVSAASDLISSPTPATEPVMPAKSAGTITVFWLGERASSENASMYFWATK